MLRLAFVSLASVLLFSCTSTLAPRMTRSCNGEYVDACRPYTYASVTAASLTPERIMLNDPSAHAQVHVEFARCAMGTLPLRVQIAAFVSGSFSEPDGGTSDARVIPLTTVGPAAAGASSLDVTIDNPFFANVPPDHDITLQFAPVIDDCQGDLFETDYHTGVVIAGP